MGTSGIPRSPLYPEIGGPAYLQFGPGGSAGLYYTTPGPYLPVASPAGPKPRPATVTDSASPKASSSKRGKVEVKPAPAGRKAR